jgi:pentatricopeptide repeat protein
MGGSRGVHKVLGIVQSSIFACNMKLKKYVKGGQPEKAMQLFQQLEQEGMNPGKFTFNHTIKACAGLQALEDDRLIHQWIIEKYL